MNLKDLEQLTRENPLDYGYWNDLGMEYKRQGRFQDGVVAYLHGVNAIFQNIYLQLKNAEDNDYFGFETLGGKASHGFWLDRAMECIVAYAKAEGIKQVRFPDWQTSVKFSDKNIYGGLLYFDKEDIRHVLPNFIHAFADCLTWNKIYATCLNNIGVAYAEIGNYDKAREYFMESIAFIPEGINYPNPFIGLEEIISK